MGQAAQDASQEVSEDGSQDGPQIRASARSAERAADTVARWRQTIVQRALVLTSAMSVLSMVGPLLRNFEGSLPVLSRVFPGAALLVTATLARTWPTNRRAYALIAGLLMGIVGGALDRGYTVPNAYVAGLLLCVLAALVLGRRAGWVVLAITCAGWSVSGYWFTHGGVPANDMYVDQSIGANWVRLIAVFAALGACTLGVVLFMVGRLEDALRNGEALYDALSKESEQRLAAVQAQQALESKLYQSQKLDSVGRLAGGVAHDFNNLLLVITGNAEISGAADEPESVRQAATADILAAAQRGSELTRHLLAFSRQKPVQAGRVDIAASVETSLALLQRLLPATITVQAQLSPNLPSAWAPAAAIEQILMNLCINARDAMPEGGTLTVYAGRARRSLPSFDGTGAAADMDFIHLSVRDTGNGMDAETVQRVFEPFFTTKDPGAGTGLGLSLVHGLAQQSGGFVDVQSEPDHGSTFNVYLAVAPHEQQPLAQQLPEPAPGDGRTLLVVDDDAQVRGTVVHALQRGGYKVLQAANGRQGIEVFQQHRDAISAVLTDAVMPVMGGRAMCEAMLASHPELPVLVASGYACEVFDEAFFRRPGRHFLAKPFSPAELLHAVGALLASAASGDTGPRPSAETGAKVELPSVKPLSPGTS